LGGLAAARPLAGANADWPPGKLAELVEQGGAPLLSTYLTAFCGGGVDLWRGVWQSATSQLADLG
jgi:hypothetical protein